MLIKKLKENEMLNTLCQTPVFCQIVAIAFDDDLKQTNNSETVLSTMTKLFAQFTYVLLKHHERSSTAKNESVTALANMALKGVLENIQMFTKDQLQEFHVRIDEDGSSFVNEVFKRNTIRAETRYSFSHLIIQEFFAALAMYLPNTMQSVNGIIEAVESSKDGRFDMFQRFFWGLASDHSWEFLKDFLVRAPHSQKQIIEWLKQSFKAHKTDKHRLISLLHCLYELNDSNILSYITEPIYEISLSRMMLTPHDCQVLSWFLQHRAKPFGKLDLSNCDISPEKIKILQPVLHRCKVLWLYGNNVKDEGMDVLSQCLHGEGGHLEMLSLGPCSLTDMSIPELEHIIRVNPNLKVLRLFDNQFSAHGKTTLENTCKMSSCRVYFKFDITRKNELQQRQKFLI